MDVVALSGTVGAGKTTIAIELGRRLDAWGYRAVAVDVDGVARSAPPGPDDPFNEQLVVEHLRTMRRAWVEADTDVLLLPRVVESVDQRDSYSEALGSPVRVVKVDAPAPTRRQRLLARHEPGPELEWHLARTDELAAILDRLHIEDFAVRNDDGRLDAVADEIVDRLGWTPLRGRSIL